MKGPNCPIHTWHPMDWLSTLNEWQYYCRLCDLRYNARMESQPVVAPDDARIVREVMG